MLTKEEKQEKHDAELDFAVKLTRSLGLKRMIAGWLSAILELIRPIPELAALVPALEWVAAAFGVTGIGHAVVKKNVKSKVAFSISAVLAALIGAAHLVPALAVALPYLTKLAAFFGAIGIGTSVGSK